LRRPNALGLAGWRQLHQRLGGRSEEIMPGLGMFMSEELAVLETSWPAGLPQGVIHADLFPDNVFFIQQQLSGLIDFYFACNDALAYDLAICLNAWCFEPDYAFNITKGRALLRGYQEVRPLTDDEKAAMPLLARGAALRFLLTRAVDWFETSGAALVKPHDPLDYVRRLRFHQRVRSISEFGA
jgi:homoserine kinase type II